MGPEVWLGGRAVNEDTEVFLEPKLPWYVALVQLAVAFSFVFRVSCNISDQNHWGEGIDTDSITRYFQVPISTLKHKPAILLPSSEFFECFGLYLSDDGSWNIQMNLFMKHCVLYVFRDKIFGKYSHNSITDTYQQTPVPKVP